MVTLVSILIIAVCILLILVVLIQNPKGGGLTSNLSSSNQFMGVKKTADFLEKATWTLAISLVVLSLVHSMIDKPGEAIQAESEIQEHFEDEPMKAPGLDQLPADSN